MITGFSTYKKMKGQYIIGIYFLIQGSQIVLSFPAPSANSRCPPGQAFFNKLSPTCYKIAEQGPCGQYMTFSILLNDTKYGHCSCEEVEEGCASRPMLFWPKENRCYPIYDQGPCKVGEWLTMSENSGDPICQSNPCSTSSNHNLTDGTVKNFGNNNKSSSHEELPSTNFTFPKDGKCFQTNTRAYCPVRKVAYFPQQTYQPICGQLENCGNLVQASISKVGPRIQCPPGKTRDITGECTELVILD